MTREAIYVWLPYQKYSGIEYGCVWQIKDEQDKKKIKVFS